MLKSYLIMSIRNIRKHKVNSMINISCLALGLTCCLLMMFWVRNDLRNDHFFQNLDRLHRVETVETQNNHKQYIDYKTSFPVAEALKNEFPEIDKSARILKKGQKIFAIEKKFFRENRLAFVDPSFFKLFTFTFIQGDPESAFNDDHSIVLSKSQAEKYFGATNPIGKTINIDNRFEVVVRGVIEDIPANTHFNNFYSIDCFVPLSLQSRYEPPMTGWNESYLVTYVLLEKGADYQELNDKLTGYLGSKHPSPKKFGYDVMLHPVKHIQLYGINGEETGINTIFISMILAAGILIIACFNFINLTTSLSLRRAKEIGIRKVLGTSRKGIIFQYLWESLLLTLVAFSLALVIASYILPFFNAIIGRQIELTASGLVGQIPYFLGLILITAVIAGSYPAFGLSSLNPISVLKKKTTGIQRKWSIRKVLVTLQIFLAALFITGTLVVYHQFKYMVKTTMGFDSKNVVCLNRGTQNPSQFEIFKNEIRKHSGIKNVSACGVVPGYSTNFAFRDAKYGGIPLKGSPLFHGLYVDYDYFKTLEISILKGTEFSARVNSRDGVVINRMAADLLGEEDPVGNTLEFNGERKQILGIVDNFPVWSLKFAMYPVVAVFNPERANIVYIKIEPASDSPKDIISHIEKKWQNHFPRYPFQYSFLEDLYQNLYMNEIRLLKISGYLAILAIFICCLGIYGLISTFIQSQLRSISIRKVLGAGIHNLAIDISGGLLKSALVAVSLAVPLVWIIMNRWLHDYAYRINLNAGLFLLGILTVFVFSLLPVFPHFLRISKLNPVHFLREE